VPVVARVHGAHHPEFHEVRRLFEEIKAKVEAAGGGQADLAREFAQLRELTDNYKVPGDVCESYAAVYEMLAELDAAYQA
jgi:regulator of cell morphogenesis and NO signaling